MGKLDHQFWKPEGRVTVRKISVISGGQKKKKKRHRKPKINWQQIHEQACKKLKVSPYSSWNALADMLCQEFGVKPCSTKNEARQKVRRYVEKGPSICREQEKPKPDFYSSQGWKELRYIALRNSNGQCNLCGAKASDGVQIHVDHIVPRSVDVTKELDLDNLQVLCDDCNLGKGNRDSIDWRKHWESL